MEPFLWSPNMPFLLIYRRRDKIKFDYCQENNRKLYYITYKEIIEDRLKEIMDEQFATNN